MDNESLLKDSGKPSSLLSSRREGSMRRTIEKKAAKIPSTYFLAAAGTAVAISLALAVTSEKKGWSYFVGQWVPTILLLGIYNKIVKGRSFEREDNFRHIH